MTFTTVVIRVHCNRNLAAAMFSANENHRRRETGTREQFCSEVAWNKQYGHLFVRGFVKASDWYVKRRWRHVQSSN